jgi:hypothetical protein
MDIEVLGKKLDTYRNKRGRIVNVPDELRMEVLLAWENWKGPAADFYRALGGSYKGMGAMIGKAKKLRREGHFPAEDFKEVKIADGSGVAVSNLSGCNAIELAWENGRIIRFGQVEQLIDFLKKAA